MSKQTPGVTPLVVFSVFVLAALVGILRRPFPHGPRRSTPNTQAHHESQGSDVDDQSRRSEDNAQSMANHRLGGSCKSVAVTCDSQYFATWKQPDAGSCTLIVKNGYQLPDSHCTPGGIDSSVTVDILRDPQWRTGCIRNCQSSEQEKHIAYAWYRLIKPKVNTGEDQTCELDHLVPLELGGADGMGNIWPECGPADAVLDGREFKVKDRVENYLANEVKAGRMPLSVAQHGIAEDWTQYLEAANSYCESGGNCGRRRR